MGLGELVVWTQKISMKAPNAVDNFRGSYLKVHLEGVNRCNANLMIYNVEMQQL